MTQTLIKIIFMLFIIKFGTYALTVSQSFFYKSAISDSQIWNLFSAFRSIDGSLFIASVNVRLAIQCTCQANWRLLGIITFWLAIRTKLSTTKNNVKHLASCTQVKKMLNK